jgi:hypothetical protein
MKSALDHARNGPVVRAEGNARAQYLLYEDSRLVDPK